MLSTALIMYIVCTENPHSITYYTTSVPYYPRDLPDGKKSHFFQKIFLAKCESLCPKRRIFLLDHTHGNKFPPLV